jgi:serine/threonine protein kinase
VAVGKEVFMPKKGSVLNSAFEAYTVERDIGGGGSGVVSLVRDTQQNAFAAKILKAGFSSQKLKRFKNEMMFCWKEDHPNLIKVLDYGRSQSAEPFYVMPLASSTLRSLLTAGIGKEDVLVLFSQILDGVEAAHLKGVTHRDLKPENILQDRDTGLLKVADFGIAHFEEDNLHTAVDTLPHERLASFEYAAPEQRRAGTRVDHRADIYSLGLILAEMFTGAVPHGLGEVGIRARYPEYSYADVLIDLMRQQDPGSRPQSIADVKQILIARRNQFVEMQRLDALKRTVIKESETDDPMLADPPQLINVSFTGSALNFDLSRAPTAAWIRQFRDRGASNSVSIVGSGPENFGFQDRTATVPAKENTAQMIVNHFKNYLATTNRLYAHYVTSESQQRMAQQRAELARTIEAEEARKRAVERVEANLKWR